MNIPFSLNRQSFAGDMWGGLAAMLVALPSAIAFGVTIFAPLGGALAAEGALAGILGATALGLVAPVLGGSSRLVTAPCAPAAAVLSALAITFTQQNMPPVAALILLGMLGLLAGLIQIGLGLAGVGRLIKFIPYPVVSGYLSGVGLIIIGSQIPKFLGAPAGANLLDALKAPGAWVWQGILVGAVTIATMVLVPRLTRAVPAAILALLAGITTYLLLGLADAGLLHTDNNPLLVGTLDTSGNLADSFQKHLLALRSLELHDIAQIMVPALTLAVLLSIDTLKTCVVIDATTRSRHDSNRELIGQGFGNVASALFGGIPGAGTMGASMVNVSSGGTTKLSGLMAGVFSLAAFLVLAPLIAWVPVSALAAILIVIGFRMIDRHSLNFFYSPSTRVDFFVILTVILVALFVNLIAASGVGVALAILLFIREQTRSSVVRNRIEGGDILSKRSGSKLERALLAKEIGDMVIFELQGSLFFGTASQLQTTLEPEAGKRKYIVLSMRRVQSLDVTATHVLEQIKDRLEESDAYLVFCDIPKDLPSGLKMKRFLKETGVVRPTNKAFAFREFDDVLEWIEQRALESMQIVLDTPAQLELRAMSLLAGCSKESITALEAAVETLSIKAGKHLFKAGAACNELYIIRQGTVKLLVPLRKKANYYLATCGPGDLIGGMSFIQSASHAVDALATTDCEIYKLSRENFEMLSLMHDDLLFAIFGTIARTLANRLHVTITELQALRG